MLLPEIFALVPVPSPTIFQVNKRGLNQQRFQQQQPQQDLTPFSLFSGTNILAANMRSKLGLHQSSG